MITKQTHCQLYNDKQTHCQLYNDYQTHCQLYNDYQQTHCQLINNTHKLVLVFHSTHLYNK